MDFIRIVKQLKVYLSVSGLYFIIAALFFSNTAIKMCVNTKLAKHGSHGKYEQKLHRIAQVLPILFFISHRHHHDGR